VTKEIGLQNFNFCASKDTIKKEKRRATHRMKKKYLQITHLTDYQVIMKINLELKLGYSYIQAHEDKKAEMYSMRSPRSYSAENGTWEQMVTS
jgi:hypothetical protein